MSNVEEAGLAGNGDEKLRKATVGDRKLHNDTISLVDYTPEWSRLFQREADRVKARAGRYRVAGRTCRFHCGAGDAGETDHRHGPGRAEFVR
ncbi:hypothetical protein [Saccharopolyspora rectivirgula]|uniref:hypothetical protein n=1 Tax=Saccharopolyspora rectivirgula TaxID=28042 RepID=UPI000B199BDB|nr:hypothetical protein [Saccharopolyspora rectivirgula]